MAQYNFLDPNQTNEYLSKATAGGVPVSEAMAYVNTRRKQQMEQNKLALDLGKQELEGMKLQREMTELAGGKAPIDAAGREKQRMASGARNTLSEMKSIYGMGDASAVGTSSDLSEGEGILSKIGRKGEDIVAGITGKSNAKRDAAKNFDDLAQMLVNQLSQAFGSGAPQEGEAKRLIASMPTRSSNDRTAAAWFRNVDKLLAQSAGEEPEQAPGLGLGLDSEGYSQDNRIINSMVDAGQLPESQREIYPQQPGLQIDSPAGTRPAINMKGEIAKYGDVIYNENKAQFETYGKPNERDMVFKRTSEGSEIDNALIKFLADSEALPIAGSVIGGLLGGTAAGAATLGLGSLAGGAVGSGAGASAGKLMQQGLRELFDPQRQDMSDIAKAVVVEGITDAVMSGAMFGVGHIAKAGVGAIKGAGKGAAKKGAETGLKLMLGDGAQAALKESAAEAEETAIKKIYQPPEGLAGKVNELINAEHKFGKADASQYLKNYGETVADTVRKSGLVGEVADGPAAYEKGIKLMQSGEKKLQALMKEKGTLNATDVINILDKAKNQVGDNPATASVVSKIDEQIEHLLKIDGDLPVSEVDKVKDIFQDLGKQAYTPKGATTMASETFGDVGAQLNHYMQKEIPGFAETSQSKALGYILNKSGMDQISAPRAKQFMNWGNYMLMGINPTAFAGKAGLDAITSIFAKPGQQAKVLDELMQMGVATQNRGLVRRTLILMTKMGVHFGAASVAGEAAKAVEPPQPESQPRLNMQPPAPMGGGGIGLNLGAYSQEGAPLYR